MNYLKLSDLIEKIIDNRGKNPEYYCENGIPVIDNYLINNNYHPKIDLVNRYIDENIYNSFLRGFIQHNDLLITLVGNGFGNCCLAPKERVAIIQNTIGLRTNSQCLPAYLYYLILSNQSKIKLLNRGAAQPSIKVSDLINIDFYVHDINEQQHIVNILGSIDDKIENNEKKIEKTKQLMQNLFIDYQNKINDDHYKKLGDYITFIKGKKPFEINNNLQPYLNIEGMETNTFENKCSDNMILANKNDLLMVMDGASSGNVYSGYQGIVGSTIAKIIVNPSTLLPIIEQKIIQMNSKIKELNTGSAIPHANKEFINSITINIQAGKKLNKLIDFLNNLKDNIYNIKNENILLSKLKSLYLKKFFS